ncbi:hypothetical protein [Exiguobacterium sp. s161]|uniref:hypothetical protein n=1 Tax=Exiguobacterium sp. s161 TaxID=2751191 RepID=UPI001BE54922|nr:hypothetical protein [Exiguobacterium sp. s161]
MKKRYLYFYSTVIELIGGSLYSYQAGYIPYTTPYIDKEHEELMDAKTVNSVNRKDYIDRSMRDMANFAPYSTGDSITKNVTMNELRSKIDTMYHIEKSFQFKSNDPESKSLQKVEKNYTAYIEALEYVASNMHGKESMNVDQANYLKSAWNEVVTPAQYIKDEVDRSQEGEAVMFEKEITSVWN